MFCEIDASLKNHKSRRNCDCEIPQEVINSNPVLKEGQTSKKKGEFKMW